MSIPISVEVLFWVGLLGSAGMSLRRFLATEKIQVAGDLQHDRWILLCLVPILLLFGLSAWFHLDTAQYGLCTLVGILLPWSLARLNLPEDVKGILTLAGVALFTLHGMSDTVPLSGALAALIMGISSITLIQSLLPPSSHYTYNANTAWSAAAPSLCFLVGLYWLKTGQTLLPEILSTSFLVGIIAIAYLVRLVQQIPSPLWNSPVTKGILLGLVSGIGTMVMSRNLLLDTDHLKFWGCLMGSTALILTLVDELIRAKEGAPTSAAQKLSALCILGILTLAASRLFGTFGWVVMATSCLCILSPRWSGYALLFWLGRVLVQGFDYQFNLNATGINLNHAYVSAALFAGFVLSWGLPQLLAGWSANRAKFTGLLMALACLLAVSANYFLHAEATGSLWIAFMTGALLNSTLNAHEGEQSIAWPQGLTLILVCLAIMTSSLLDAGTFATRSDQLGILALVVAAGLGYLALLSSPVLTQITQSGSKA